nr:urea amidolyase associated protein UAAP2 [uncultured Desulfobulbus sp.]
MQQTLKTSTLDPQQASYNATIAAGTGWMYTVKKGEILRITDLHGNQAVDTIFFNANRIEERYNAANTMREQGNVYITAGTEIRSNDNNVLLTVVADICGRHDTLGSACSCESNTARYALEKRYMHSCRDIFLKEILDWGQGMDKRDQVCNINFFMNVPVNPEGGSNFEDGISEANKYVELRAEMDVIVLISNCPQLNNPCNAYNPTPVEVRIWSAQQ